MAYDKIINKSNPEIINKKKVQDFFLNKIKNIAKTKYNEEIKLTPENNKNSMNIIVGMLISLIIFINY